MISKQKPNMTLGKRSLEDFNPDSDDSEDEEYRQKQANTKPTNQQTPVAYSNPTTGKPVQQPGRPVANSKPNDIAAPAEGGEKKPEASTELLKTKKARHFKPFTEDLLVCPDGLEKVYNEFPLKLKYTKNMTEGQYLKRLITSYKEWAFQLHPGISFTDVVSKCESLGSKGKTRTCMGRIRERERDRYLVSRLSSDQYVKLTVISFSSLTCRMKFFCLW
jgi:hypothetical protein